MNSLIRKYILGFTAAAFTAAVFFSTVGLPETVRISAEKELLSGNETKEESAVISEKSESAEDLKETAQREADQKKDDQKQDSEEKDTKEKDDQKRKTLKRKTIRRKNRKLWQTMSKDSGISARLKA